MDMNLKQYWWDFGRNRVRRWLTRSLTWGGGATFLLSILLPFTSWPADQSAIFAALAGGLSFFVVLIILIVSDLAFLPYSLHRQLQDEKARLYNLLQPRLSVYLPDPPVSVLRQGSTVETLGSTLYSAITNWIPSSVCLVCRNDSQWPLEAVSAAVLQYSVDGTVHPLPEPVALSVTPATDELLDTRLAPGEAKRFWIGRATSKGGFFLLRDRTKLIFEHQRCFTEDPALLEIEILFSARQSAGVIATVLITTAADDSTGDGMRIGKVTPELTAIRPAVQIVEAMPISLSVTQNSKNT